ncbi:hypothetical protein NUH86_02525 [Sphingobium sp. JS3065]|uniref:hypothetical protein n=1 Tax=Sphingobium sp. JS3065 TaxID=2970925 RepID=UPI0022650AD2|nr:hypothetical protein [Sphingobium sp. JS3065]UZW55697.1 hypothetical protein NUH86_02525 [Sphingobium sp. JS3065]
MSATAPPNGLLAATDAVAEQLNLGCFCISLDRKELGKALDRAVRIEGFAERLSASHPTLFSSVPVFVPSAMLAKMMLIVDAVEGAAQLPAYRAAALAYAPPTARLNFGPVGAFMGYDFHLAPDGPKLIEVNTNAGGAFLNAFLAGAQHACCPEAEFQVRPLTESDFAERVTRMFAAEWQLQRGSGQPALIAIVDDLPEQQHLYPEFQLAKEMLEGQGIPAVIVDPSELGFDGQKLTANGRTVDLVYNRLVDFSLEEPRHAALQAAYLQDAVVLTPSPHVHALFADKRNLALLSEDARLEKWGLSAARRAVLRSGLPRTAVVTAANSGDLWRERRDLFFKPARGHGSKAAYRGDKLTRRVWDEIVSGEYVAQAFAAPTARNATLAGESIALKTDIRLYTYAGELLLAAARLYKGQTTNMRTAGGGFAPVLEVTGPVSCLEQACGQVRQPSTPGSTIRMS